jgi:hypothetical protein
MQLYQSAFTTKFSGDFFMKKSLLTASLSLALLASPINSAFAHGGLFDLLFSSCIASAAGAAVGAAASRPSHSTVVVHQTGYHPHSHYHGCGCYHYKMEAKRLLKDIALYGQENVISEALHQKLDALSQSPDQKIADMDDHDKIALIKTISESIAASAEEQ